MESDDATCFGSHPGILECGEMLLGNNYYTCWSNSTRDSSSSRIPGGGGIAEKKLLMKDQCLMFLVLHCDSPRLSAGTEKRHQATASHLEAM